MDKLGWLLAALMLSWHTFDPLRVYHPPVDDARISAAATGIGTADAAALALGGKLAICEAEVASLKEVTQAPGRPAQEQTPCPPPPPPPPPCEKCQKCQKCRNCEAVGSIGTFMNDMNALCSVLAEDPAGAQAEVAVTTYFFCLAHLAEYRRVYDYAWDKGTGEMGYYRGSRFFPMQMATEQYLGIMVTIMAVPPKELRAKMLEQGGDFVDSTDHYSFIGGHYNTPDGASIVGKDKGHPRGTDGPNVLIMGCGSDVPMWTTLVGFLGGKVVFIDDSVEWAETCRSLGADPLHVVQYGQTMLWHTEQLANTADTGADAAQGAAHDDLFAQTQMNMVKWPPGVASAEQPFDVIVVDGPSGATKNNTGRSQPLYAARRLAESYHPNHYTHVFLHDAAREYEVLIANKIMGHDPKHYQGNLKPRKGLKHWRLPGQDRPFPSPSRD